MNNDLQSILPPLNPGWTWEASFGVISRVHLVSTEGHYLSEVISLAPNDFLEPAFLWTNASDITERHLQVTAKRLLKKLDRHLADKQSAQSLEARYGN